MSFDARESTVGKLLNNAIYRIPRNQRSYVWNEQNCNDLYSDIMLVAEGTANSHFLGSIVLKKEQDESGIDVYTIIDGQQRVITLTLLVCAIIFEFKRRHMDADASGTKKYVVATDNKGIDREIVNPEHHLALPKIAKDVAQFTSDDMKKYSERSFAKERCVSKEKDRLIAQAFIFFDRKFQNLSGDELISFRDSLVDTQFVQITSGSEEDLYTIFEILNARGLPLDDSDLLKNYIMRYIQPESKRDDAKLEWLELEQHLGEQTNNFLRHYAIASYRFTSKDRDVYKKIRDNADPHKAKELLEDLVRKSCYYENFINPTVGSEEGDILSYFKQHRVQVFRPLILSLMHKREIEAITDDCYLDELNYIYRFYICYKVIGGLESNQLTDLIGKYAYIIESDFNGQNTLDEWRKSFQEKLPSLESFKRSFAAMGWSHVHAPFKAANRKDQCKVVLELIEREKSGFRTTGECTIEHILPDANDDNNASIGNLLLLESGLNNRCKNLPLMDKLPIYRESRFATTRGFANRYADRQFDISKRTDYLARLTYKIIMR